MAGEALVSVVPGEAFACAVGDVGEKSALVEAVAVLDIAGGALARLDGIEELADVTGRIRNGGRRGTEILLLLSLDVDFVAVVVGDESSVGALENDAAAHGVEAGAALRMKGPGEEDVGVFGNHLESVGSFTSVIDAPAATGGGDGLGRL